MARNQAVQLEYLFCRNVDCNVHATFIVGAHPPDAKLVFGQQCPFCQAGTIDKILLDPVATVPAGVGSVPTGIVLPAAPYGGFVLRRGDNDASRTWGGSVVADPRHEGAHYVAELQRDLLRLGYYGPARGGEKLGVFGLQLMACVLDFKRHLTLFHGVPANADAQQVQAQAAQPNAPVHFPPQGLVSPAEVFSGVASWAKLLGTTRQQVPAVATIKKWATEWEKLRAVDAPRTLGEVNTLRSQANADKATTSRLTHARVSAMQAQARFAQSMARLEFPRRQGTLTEPQVVEAEQRFETMLAEINAIGGELPRLLTSVKTLDARIPGATSGSEPGNDPVVLVPVALSSTTLDARFDRMQDARARAPRVLTAQQRVLDFTRAKTSGFAGRLDHLGRRLTKFDELGAGLATGLTALTAEVRSASEAASQLNQAEVRGTARPSEPVNRARRLSRQWLQGSASDPPEPAGALEQITQTMAAFERSWAQHGFGPPADHWRAASLAVVGLRGPLNAYASEVHEPKAQQWEEAYSSMLREFGSVDSSVARHLRRMVTQGELNGRKVFLTPMDDEIVELQGKFSEELPRLMDQAIAELRRGARPAPVPIITFIFDHESGSKHSAPFAGRRFVKLGIDWPNKKGNSAFNELTTPGRSLSKSRGWGASQITFFETGTPARLKDESGIERRFVLHSGVPYAEPNATARPLPLAIKSAEENTVQGIKLYIQNFAASSVKRECSFEPSATPVSSRSFDCRNCAKHLKTGPGRRGDEGIRVFDDAEGDFERVIVDGGPRYRMRDIERLRELLRTGFFRLADGRAPEEARQEDLNEFPCSWLAAVMRYSGSGRRPFDYMLEAIEVLQKR